MHKLLTSVSFVGNKYEPTAQNPSKKPKQEKIYTEKEREEENFSDKHNRSWKT